MAVSDDYLGKREQKEGRVVILLYKVNIIRVRDQILLITHTMSDLLNAVSPSIQVSSWKNYIQTCHLS